MSKLNLFIPLTKVDEERRLVFGKITEEKLDKSGEIMDYGLSKKNFEEWSAGFEKATDGKSMGNLRVMHGDKVAGKFTKVAFNDDDKSIEGCAKVVDDSEWAKVLEGCYTGFSIGGSYGKVTKEAGGIKRYEARPTEVSLVDNPCVHGAVFEVAKADGAVELRKFQKELPGDEPNEPGEQRDPGDEDPELVKVADKAKELCKAAGFDPDEELSPAAGETPAVLKWHGFVEDAKKDLAEPGSVDVNPGVMQKWVASDGTSFGTKAEAVAHDQELKVQKTVTDITKPAADALAKLNAELDRVEGKDDDQTAFQKLTAEDQAKLTKAFKLEGEALEKFVNDADPAALNAVLGKQAASVEPTAAVQPAELEVKTVDDLQRAIKSFSRAKEPELVKAALVAKAKELGATDDLPADWDGSTIAKDAPHGGLKKGMYTVSRLANLIESIAWLRCDCKAERDMEGDDSKVPEQLDANLAGLGATLIAMVQEEVSELVTMGMDPADVAAVAPLLAMSADPDGLIKGLVGEELEPLRKSLSAAAVAQQEELAKRAGDGSGDTLSKAEGDALRQTVSDLTEELTKAVNRIGSLERLPAEAKGLRRVTKTQDSTDSGPGAGDGDPLVTISKALDQLPEGERAMALMKAAMNAGRVLAD